MRHHLWHIPSTFGLSQCGRHASSRCSNSLAVERANQDRGLNPVYCEYPEDVALSMLQCTLLAASILRHHVGRGRHDKNKFARFYKIDEFAPTEITPNFYIFVGGMKRVRVILYWQSISLSRGRRARRCRHALDHFDEVNPIAGNHGLSLRRFAGSSLWRHRRRGGWKQLFSPAIAQVMIHQRANPKSHFGAAHTRVLRQAQSYSSMNFRSGSTSQVISKIASLARAGRHMLRYTH